MYVHGRGIICGFQYERNCEKRKKLFQSRAKETAQFCSHGDVRGCCLTKGRNERINEEMEEEEQRVGERRGGK